MPQSDCTLSGLKRSTLWNAAEQASQARETSARSNEAQGIERIPEEHLGHKMTALERKGVETTVGNRNRETKKRTPILIRDMKRRDKKIHEKSGVGLYGDTTLLFTYADIFRRFKKSRSFSHGTLLIDKELFT